MCRQARRSSSEGCVNHHKISSGRKYKITTRNPTGPARPAIGQGSFISHVGKTAIMGAIRRRIFGARFIIEHTNPLLVRQPGADYDRIARRNAVQFGGFYMGCIPDSKIRTGFHRPDRRPRQSKLRAIIAGKGPPTMTGTDGGWRSSLHAKMVFG